jgi:alkylation response protein AidB-like acyl-CoA dehydrogenase
MIGPFLKGRLRSSKVNISRVLCDARILNIFEGAAEIQAQVIARRLLETN